VAARCVRVDVITVLTPCPYASVPRRGWRRRRWAVYDASAMRAASVASFVVLAPAIAPAMPWQNRPTFQQVVQVR
jgi:hypothetical protein